MKVKCITINTDEIEIKKDLQTKIQSIKYEFLEVEKIYTVYGMIVDQGKIFYYICDRAHQYFPVKKPFDLFELIDRRPSRYWIFSFIEGYKKYPCWMFPEWFDDIYYQDKLTDGEEKELNIFLSYKKHMDLEYPDITVKEKATIGDENWLLCPICLDAWESTSNDGMVICPNCQNVIHNPRYAN